MPHRVLSELLTAEYLRPWAFWLFVPAVLFVLLDIVAARRTVLAALLRLLVFACLIFKSFYKEFITGFNYTPD